MRLQSFSCFIIWGLAFSACTQRSSELKSLGDDAIIHLGSEIETPDDVNSIVEHAFNTAAADIVPEDEDASSVAIDDIVNTGKKLWKVVQDGKAVATITSATANALPRGAKASDITGFSSLQKRTLRYCGINKFKMKVYDVTYTLVHRYGGSYKGKGKYLADVAIVASATMDKWGWYLNAESRNISIMNHGTSANPIAGVVMELKQGVSTFINVEKYDQTQIFAFRGDRAAVEETSGQLGMRGSVCDNYK